MKKTNIALLIFVYGFSFLAGFILGQNYQEKIYEEKKPFSSAIYRCDDNKFIIADYFEESVTLRLSDNRFIILPQTVSELGVRFADKNNIFVFLNKGENASVEELNKRTFSNCVSNGSANY